MSTAWGMIGMAECAKIGGLPCEAAYKPLKRCVELDPDHAVAHSCLGNVLLNVREDLPRAEEHFQAAVRLDPKLAPARFALAGVLERRDDLDEAIREMLEYVFENNAPTARVSSQ